VGCPAKVDIGRNLVFSICTHDPDTGILTDADAPPEYRLYAGETGTPVLTGTMDKLDDAHTTGFYAEAIACTAGNGFVTGLSYTLYIEATVDGNTGGISYGFTVGEPNVIADAVLVRDFANVEADAPNHSLASAGLKATSRVTNDPDAGTIVTYRTDGTTPHMTQNILTDGDLEAIAEIGAAA
jgi:hypothetical protein